MLVSLKDVCRIAQKRCAAVGSFNTTNSESLFAVLHAARDLDVPVIIAHAQCHEYAAHLDDIAPLMIAAAKVSPVPVCVHLDHGEDLDYCRRAIEKGFTSVMIDCSRLPFEENVRATRAVCDLAHERGVDVEAELGAMPSGEGQSGGDVASPESCYTDPALVRGFLEGSGADALAIAFGTQHGLYRAQPKLSFDVIKRVREQTSAPLVMHGGSGVSDEDYRRVIEAGISKINYYTYMSYAGYAAARETVEKKSEGYYHDLSLNAEKAMYDKVMKALKVFNNL